MYLELYLSNLIIYKLVKKAISPIIMTAIYMFTVQLFVITFAWQEKTKQIFLYSLSFAYCWLQQINPTMIH